MSQLAWEQLVAPQNQIFALTPIDYGKLVEQFGTKLITNELLERFERVTGKKLHRFLR
jgi:hypothetical protein